MVLPLRARLTRCVGAVRTVDGRPLLVGGGLSGERYPPGSVHLDRRARLPPDPGRTGGGLAVRGAAGCGHGYTAPGCVPPIAVIRMVAEGFCSGGGFSAGLGRVFLPDRAKTLPAPDTDPTEPHWPGGRLREPWLAADRERMLSKIPLYRDHLTRSTTTPHISQKSRNSSSQPTTTGRSPPVPATASGPNPPTLLDGAPVQRCQGLPALTLVD